MPRSIHSFAVAGLGITSRDYHRSKRKWEEKRYGCSRFVIRGQMCAHSPIHVPCSWSTCPWIPRWMQVFEKNRPKYAKRLRRSRNARE